jgi:phage terminase large subunit-like protein
VTLERAPRSEADRVAHLSPTDFTKWMKGKTERDCEALETDWHFWQRDDQRPPEGHWHSWLLMAGRGFGKTRVGAEWVRHFAENHDDARIAIVGATFAEARSVMIEGMSGLLAIAPEKMRPTWEPSRRLLTWPNGAIGEVYSAAEPDGLRGGAHHIGWADEIAKWDQAIPAWNNLMMMLRVGRMPQVIATTTPRPVPIVRRLLAEAGVAVTRGATVDNALNLSGQWIDTMRSLYGGTRLGRQELGGETIDDVEGALWSRDLIEVCRVAAAPALARTVIGVDPPAGTNGDACGIVVVGLGDDGKAYVLADASVQGKSPEGWARAVAVTARRWNADRVVAEGNQGGAMVESTLRAADVAMPIKRVFASIGKSARAEPVLALYETGRVCHVGAFEPLEDELCGLIIGGGYEGPGKSPDRADALVWAMSELMLGGVSVPRVRGM